MISIAVTTGYSEDAAQDFRFISSVVMMVKSHYMLCAGVITEDDMLRDFVILSMLKSKIKLCTRAVYSS